jgi:hypothetical protein
MPVKLPEPTGVSATGEPTWNCPHCNIEKELQDFGLRKRDDISPGKNIWHKQSHCIKCRSEKP